MGRGKAWRRLALALALAVLAAGGGLSARGQLVINEFMALNGSITNPLGDTSDWIEIYNGSAASVSLNGWFLTDDATDPAKWAFPNVSVPARGYRLVWADGGYETPLIGTNIYAELGLSGNGEYLALVKPDLTVAHAYAPSFPPQSADVSYGIGPGNALRFFDVPTPGQTNNAGIFGSVADTRFYPDRGFYTNPISVTITSATPGAAIYYTRDFSDPGPGNGTLVNGPVSVTNTTVLRARAFKTGYTPTDIDTHTYVFVADVIRQSPTGSAPPGFPSSPVNSQLLDYGMDPDVVNSATYSNLVDDALLAIPTLSLVTVPSNLFNSSVGIYVNAMNDGAAWERPGSLELINPDGSEGFQVGAGIRIRGGSSREPDNPKHAFRLFFDDAYGDGALNYPLFGDEGADSFRKLDLRTEQNYSWSYARDGNANTMLRDIYARDLQGRTGQPYSRGRQYHLYINGQYWGIYQTDERKEANFGETYLGGNDDDYDALKPDRVGWPLHVVPTDGTTNAYQRLQNAYFGGFSNNTAYFRAQGMNTDGTRNPAYERLVDVDNLAAFMLTVFFTADKDAPVTTFYGPNTGPNNFYALYNRASPDGWKFLRHDAEHSMDKGETDRTGPFPATLASQLRYFTPQALHDRLAENVEYRLRFADLVHKAMFNGGAMTAAGAVEAFNKRAAEIDQAIIAESARWGDSKSASPKTRNGDWVPLITYLSGTWLPARTAAVLDQLKADGLYPNVDAPVFQINGTNQFGGLITSGATLGMTGPGTLYYTLDHGDPRERLTGNAVGAAYGGGVGLTRATLVRARARNGGVWSALNETVYVPVALSPLRVSELMFHPRDPQPGTAETNFSTGDFEFIELRNTGAQTIGLADAAFAGGVRFDFAGGAVATLAPGEHVVLVRSLAAFQTRYTNWAAMKIAGVYAGRFHNPSGALADSGEELTLVDKLGRTIQEFDYKDSWQPCADGEGFSLVALDPAAADDKAGWRHSARVDGSPGADDTGEVLLPPGAVVINEVLSHQDVENPGDWIELRNTTGAPVNLGGWYLSDSAGNLRKYRIPNGTILTNTLVFTEYQHFGTNAWAAGTNGFALSEFGDAVYLSAGTAGGALASPAYREAEDFGVAARGVTFGRHARSDGVINFPALAAPTTNAPNSGPRVGPVVFRQIQYHPVPGDHEFLELTNITAETVALYDPANPANTWKVGGVGFTFPTNLALVPGGRLFLVRDTILPADFRALKGLPGSVGVFNYAGALDDAGETVTLERPGEPEAGTGFVPYITVERVDYGDRSPWPLQADGEGPALQRVSATAYGNDPGNWNTGFPYVERRVEAGNDDVQQRPMIQQTMTLDGLTLELGKTATFGAGLRFASVAIPAGAVVTNAYLQFTAAGTNVAAVSLDVFAEAADSAAAFTGAAGNLSGRATTVAHAVWNPGAWHTVGESGPAQRTPNLAAAVQEVVSRPGWTSGNALAFVVKYLSSAGTRPAWAWEGRGEDAALLHVSFVVTGTTTTSTSTSSTSTSAPVTTTSSSTSSTSTSSTSTSSTTSSTSSSTSTSAEPGSVAVLIPTNAVWRYLDTGVNAGTGWRAIGYDDGAWAAGPAELGYGDGDEATTNSFGASSENKFITTYYRRAFVLGNAGAVTSLFCRLLRDDGAVVYLNGNEVRRDNMPAGAIGYLTLSTNATGTPEEFTFFGGAIAASNLVNGTNVLAVEIHQQSPGSSDISFNLELLAWFAPGPSGMQDADGDGLPDVWEWQYFVNGTGAAAHAQSDLDGMSNYGEWIAGTDPTNSRDVLAVGLIVSNGAALVSFPTVDPAGRPGYDGLLRFYTLEESTNIGGGPWLPVANQTNIPGGGSVTVTNAVPAGLRFYRARTWLQ